MFDHISNDELVIDLIDTTLDIYLCKTALEMGIKEYSDGKLILERLFKNMTIGCQISNLLEGRGIDVQIAVVHSGDVVRGVDLCSGASNELRNFPSFAHVGPTDLAN
jgi:hypothetical protein